MLPILHGVPQGSILGPLLFTFFINGIPNHISKCKIRLYADVTVIICAGKTAEEVQISLQHNLNCALQWFKANRLYLNVKKTKWSLIGTYQKLGQAKQISITVNGEQLERVDEYKTLTAKIILTRCVPKCHNDLDSYKESSFVYQI